MNNIQITDIYTQTDPKPQTEWEPPSCVGRALVWLPSHGKCLVFSAKLCAFELAILIAKTNRPIKCVMFSDSLNALTQLETLHYDLPALRKMQHDLITMFMKGHAVEFCWVPGHAGIRGNELADSRAKLASTHQEQFITIHYRDWFPIINSRITFR